MAKGTRAPVEYTEERQRKIATNLVQNRPRTPEEQEAYIKQCSEWGKAGQKKLKESKTVRECLLMILNAEVASEEQREKVRAQFGIDDEFITNKLLINLSLFKQALKGDVGAYRQIMQVLGNETQVQQGQSVNINIVPFEAVQNTQPLSDVEEWE